VFVLAMMAFSALTTLFAQQSAEATGVTTLSSNAELVLVPVQVRDSAGKPVRGLLQGDFVVRSDGKVQQIKIFEESGANREEASASEKQDEGSSDEKEFSSVPEGGLPEELLIVAIDQVNTPIAEQAHVRQELQKYFEKLTSGQALALVAITPAGLRQIQTFTSDPKVLLAAVTKEQGKLGKTEAVTDGRVAAHPLTCRYCDTDAAAYQSAMQGNASAATLESFAQLQQAYDGIQGRKSVVWLTTETTDAEPISNILNRSNISLYPVNVRGAQADSQFLGEQHVEYRSLDDPANVARGGVTPVTTEIVGGLKKTEDNTGLRVLATRTGGRYCSSMAALQGCLDQAAKDSSSYYVLGFYVPQQERVVGWHKLDVHLTSGQEKIHTRSGYYLGAKSAQGEKDVRTELLVAANAEIGYT